VPQSTAQLYLGLGGINVNGAFTRSAPGQLSEQLTPDLLVAGLAGTLTTRTDNDTGVVTLGAGHGIQQNDKVSVSWDGGSRISMSVTNVAGNLVTVDLGSGDNLPAQASAVVVAKVIRINCSFAGNDLEMVAAVCGVDLAVGFYNAADALLLQLKLKGGNAQGEPWFWVKNAGIANPLAGAAVAYILVGNGEAEASTFSLSALRD
jgi:hypothetical protein